MSGGSLRRAGRFVRPLSAEFGCFRQAARNWADFETTKKSYELDARYVVPHYRRRNVNRAASLAWTFENTKDFNARRETAAEAMFAKHAAERAAERRAAV